MLQIFLINLFEQKLAFCSFFHIYKKKNRNMKQLLKDFKRLIEETEDFPKDELRDYYLVPAKDLLKKIPEIASIVVEEQSALMMVVKQIIKGGHLIRINHLNAIAEDLIEITPKEILNHVDKDKNSLIHITCEMESFSVGLLDFMKENGADFSIFNKKGETPLMLVAISDSLDDLKFIHNYTRKELFNHKDINGSTALHKAVKAKKINNVYYLLEHGSSVLIKDNNNNLPIDLLNNKDNKKNHVSEEIKKILIAFNEKENADNKIKMMIQK